VEDFLGNGRNIRDDKWTKSIAVGNGKFVERVKSLMDVLAIGRKSIEAGESCQLREPGASYGAHFGPEKCDKALKTYFFGILFRNNQYVSLVRPNATMPLPNANTL